MIKNLKKEKNMQVNFSVLMLISFLFIFLSSCNETNNLIKGTNGLNIDLSKIPNSFVDQNQFKLLTLIHNIGYSNAKNIDVDIIAVDDYLIQFSKENNYDSKINLHINELKGLSEFPEGEKKMLNFNMNVLDLDEAYHEKTTRILFKLNYEYETHLATSIYINTDLMYDESHKEYEFDSQGSPLAITKITTDVLMNENKNKYLRIEIFGNNKGNGELLFSNKASVKLSNEDMDCSTNKNAQDLLIICNKKLEQQGKYISQLTIDLSFNYRESFFKDIKIINIPKKQETKEE